MPDRSELVRTRLGSLGLRPEREAEIVAELSSHLEDLYEELRREGLSEEDALQRAFSRVDDWGKLRRCIRHVLLEEGVLQRVKDLSWLLILSLVTFYCWSWFPPGTL